MTEKKELETWIYSRMYRENKDYLTDLKTKSIDEIIESAYEIACRENILMIFEDETGLSTRQLEALMELKNPLAELYDDWLSRDTDEMDNFRDSVRSFVNDILDRKEKEKDNNIKSHEVRQKKEPEMER